MSHDHIVELPKAVWPIKIVQAIITALVLAFSCFTIAIIPNGWSGFGIFTAIFSGVALAYYFVSIHANKHLFNWIALLVLECFAVLWWLVVWALLATWIAAAAYYTSVYGKRNLSKRVDPGTVAAAEYLVYVTMAIALINWVLYIVTLVFMSMAIHRHRMAGKPMAAGHSSSSGWNNASRAEKHNMQPMPSAQTYNNYESNSQAPVPGPMHYEHQPQQAPGYQNSPTPVNTHEAYGGTRYP